MQSSKASWLLWIVVFAPLIIFSPAAEAVKRENFKTCEQSGFCKRNRAFADATSSNVPGVSAYRLDSSSIKHSTGQLRATILKIVAGSEIVRLPFNITLYKSGVARVTIDEEKRRNGEIELRHGSKARKERYDEADSWALVDEPSIDESTTFSEQTQDGITTITYGDSLRNAIKIRHHPFSIEFARDGDEQVVFNRQGLLNIEQWRPKIEAESSEENSTDVDSNEDESTWWEESFGGNTDSKPKGPESVAVDISFPGYQHVFGIPEHTGPLSLRETR
ncbi:MAG: hypothetical protein LQ347_002953 [Umbilicaria vellea]|nr:MAG: hypothetical protein LQ347_002953 [Umbilicaria vellea]